MDATGFPLDRYHAALSYAAELHRGQLRKGSGIPYLAHLLAVSSLVIEYGGDGDQAIAALLHDAIEDQADANGGDAVLAAEIERLFGAEVLRIVLACTDAVMLPKPPRSARRQACLARLRRLDFHSALVAAADKLHNARAILADFRMQGDAVFARFGGSKAETLAFHAAIADCFRARHPGPLADELSKTVAQLLREAEAGAATSSQFGRSRARSMMELCDHSIS